MEDRGGFEEGGRVSDAREIMLLLAKLSEVQRCLTYLEQEKIVQPGAVAKGCCKFTADHPQLRCWIGSGALSVPKGGG